MTWAAASRGTCGGLVCEPWGAAAASRAHVTSALYPHIGAQGPGLVNVRWAGTKRQVFNWADTQTCNWTEAQKASEERTFY